MKHSIAGLCPYPPLARVAPRRHGGRDLRRGALILSQESYAPVAVSAASAALSLMPDELSGLRLPTYDALKEILTQTQEHANGHSGARNDAMMDEFKVGDRVRFKQGLVSGALRQGQIGTVIAVYDPPAQGASVVDIRFDDGTIERGIRIHQIEPV